MSFVNFLELFALQRVQCAETFTESARGVERVSVCLQVTTDDLEDVDAAGKRIGDGPETVSRERLAVAVLATDALSVRTRIDRLAPFSFMVRGIRSVSRRDR